MTNGAREEIKLTGTYAEVGNEQLITPESMRAAFIKMADFEKPLLVSEKISFLEKVMNHFGWYRSPAFYVIRESKIRNIL